MIPDPAHLAAIHARAITPAWTEAALRDLLDQPGVWAEVEADGFVLMRQAGDEAEVLTLAVLPEARRRGLAQALLHHAGAHALGELGARRLVLVADPDHHALDLYLGAGFARTESQVSAEGLRTPARP